jgi:hypothetical protein
MPDNDYGPPFDPPWNGFAWQDTASERLQRHLSDDAEIAAWQARDAAYGRMLDAAQAGDDIAYERARCDFWGLSK